MSKTYKTPGVYIEETSAFPNAVVPVPTAVPAFIGYTEKANSNKKDLTNQPTRISSLSDYLLCFGGAPGTKYALSKSATPEAFALETKVETRFLLYYSIKFFFANGGADCYIVSVGNYDSKPDQNDFEGTAVVTGATILRGISALEKEPAPSLLVIPDAVLLGENACASLQQSMLAHCEQLGSRFAILDVSFDENDTKVPNIQDIVERFRNLIGTNGLQWGAAYFPWLHTTIISDSEISFLNLDLPSMETLYELLIAELDMALQKGLDASKEKAIRQEITKLLLYQTDKSLSESETKSLHQSLLAISILYKQVMAVIKEKINLLPPSGAMAGLYSMVDNSKGVFHAPANISVNSVVKPLLNISDKEQQDMNAPIDGKAVNAIRNFPGMGVLVWGARTLDSNSLDWRYINIRRTVIFIEQSIKNTLEPFVFEPNDANTWSKVKTLIENFLTNIWRSGGLAGATPDQAFSVQVGLGTTMTADDISEGMMRILVHIAISHPAEFIIISFQLQVQKA